MVSLSLSLSLVLFVTCTMSIIKCTSLPLTPPPPQTPSSDDQHEINLPSTSRQHGNDNFAAAACCARGPRCWPQHMMDSKLCEKGVWMSAQPRSCQRSACRYCHKNGQRRSTAVCKSIPILKNCFNVKPPYMTSPDKFKPPTSKPMPPPTVNKPQPKVPITPQRTPPKHHIPPSKPAPPGRRKHTNCRSFAGTDGKVVIPASAMPANGHWVRTSFNRKSGLTWKPKGHGGVDRPENGSPFCMRFRADRQARYYFTVISSAPHGTEHNDAWFRFTQAPGFSLYRPQGNQVRNGGTNWLKGYQNDGKNKLTNYILSIDFNGHQFVTPKLVKGRDYQVCVAGRSSKYTIHAMVLVACGDDVSSCNRYLTPIQNALKSLPKPRCA